MKLFSFFLVISLMIGFFACGFFWFKRTQKKHAYPGKTIFAFMGKPGSGKSTLAEQCQNILGFKILSIGNLCRAKIAAGTEDGRLIEQYLKAGKLIPDNLAFEMINQGLSEIARIGTHIILDGYPRNTTQAAAFLNLLKKKYAEYDFRIILLDVSDQEVIPRLFDRLVCANKSCQSIYSRKLLSLICPACGALLVQRIDDNQKVIEERLKSYHDQQDKLVSFYTSAGYHVEIIPVAGLTFFQVFNELKKILPER